MAVSNIWIIKLPSIQLTLFWTQLARTEHVCVNNLERGCRPRSSPSMGFHEGFVPEVDTGYWEGVLGNVF